MYDELKNAITDFGDKVAIYDGLAEAVIRDQLDYTRFLEEEVALFKEHFRIVNRNKVLSDPEESFDNGVNFIRVIERLSDGKLFGFVYWEELSKYGELHLEPNGDEHGFVFEWNEDYYPLAYVFLPVKPFTVTGYEIEEVEED